MTIQWPTSVSGIHFLFFIFFILRIQLSNSLLLFV
jgi:hypothetical protein